MSSRPLVVLGVMIIILALAAAAGYLIHGRAPATLSANMDSLPQTVAATTTSNTQYNSVRPISTSTDSLKASLQSEFPMPSATSSADRSSWTMQVDNEQGYSIEYPSAFLPSTNQGAFLLTMPRSYFHWPLQDDVKITTTVASSCPKMMVSGGLLGHAVTDTFALGKLSFTRSIGTDAAAGNRYLEIAYDTKANGFCYHLSMIDHGANGASIYVDDPYLIPRYDAQHEADLLSALSVFNSIVSSLRILAPAQ